MLLHMVHSLYLKILTAKKNNSNKNAKILLFLIVRTMYNCIIIHYNLYIIICIIIHYNLEIIQCKLYNF